MKYCFFILAIALIFTKPLRAALPCESPLPQSTSLAVGLSFQILMPDSSLNFGDSLAAYGPTLSLPVGIHAFQAQASYASQSTTQVYLSETAFRMNFPTPFFTPFLSVGAHFLHSTGDVPHDYFGANGGTGLFLPMGRLVDMELATHVFSHPASMVSFGGKVLFKL